MRRNGGVALNAAALSVFTGVTVIIAGRVPTNIRMLRIESYRTIKKAMSINPAISHTANAPISQ